MVISIIALFIWGLKLGIDFTGGSLMELEFTDRPTNQTIQEKLADLNLATLNLQPTGEKGLLIRTVSLSETVHQEILKRLNELSPTTNINATTTNSQDEQTVMVPASALGIEGEGAENLKIEVTGKNVGALLGKPVPITDTTTNPNVTELRFDSIGPSLGKELQRKAFYAIVIVLLAIIAYIAYAFRKVSQPVKSWKYGLAAIIALAHDILIVTGIYTILGHFLGYQADSLFITALLTILGFSVHDTIVTLDRIRENLHRHQEETFETVVNRSINETIIRSINTSLTTFFVLLTIFLFGGKNIQSFALTLMLGIIIGTYSSIFIASPLLIISYKFSRR